MNRLAHAAAALLLSSAVLVPVAHAQRTAPAPGPINCAAEFALCMLTGNVLECSAKLAACLAGGNGNGDGEAPFAGGARAAAGDRR